jgi:hypothetical protein
MCTWISSPVNGASVMTWFIFTTWAGGFSGGGNSSRIFFAASIHSGLRNSYFSATDTPL